MVQESLKASEMLAKEGINIEVIDLRTVKPLDENLILASVQKTGRLVVVDGGWRTCGLSAEVSALVSERAFGALKASVVRITLPDCPAPASAILENAYYRTSTDIIRAVKSIL
jgi:pyruvate dehydrogenase E1 component beta subunit